ncbi:MAG TPA: ASKHA domain-containing protein [Anaerolineales bacterium]|nr:ASKHA domain-containing protein [Anaerolineales bacterium]
MAEHKVVFDLADQAVSVNTGTLLSEAARLAGVEISQPCGGQGRCGRCAVQVVSGSARRRSSLRLSPEDVANGYALACQTVIEADVEVVVPPQEKIERRLTTDRTVAEITVPVLYDYQHDQSIRRLCLSINPPTMDDQTDDWSRLQTALRQQAGIGDLQVSLNTLRKLSGALREGDWTVAVTMDSQSWDCPNCPARVIDVQPGRIGSDTPMWGIAIDIGTTTVTVWLVDLVTGEVRSQASEYNGQISRGEDVISRIIYSSKNGGSEHLRTLVLETINELIERVCKRTQTNPTEIIKASVSGNSTMMHLLLGIPSTTIRLAPFVTVVNHVPTFVAEEVGLQIHPNATVDCLPGVASYVGADISAGVLSSGMDDTEKLTLFMDVGTNGETVLGSREWLVTCACSAGPAFEGAGVIHGMRATKGAIEEVWINSNSLEPTYRVIGGGKARGLCGSGLISLLAEMFMTGVIDKGGHINTNTGSKRIREGDHGMEYVIAWSDETAIGSDLVITYVDIDNLLRAKAAIYAGFSVLAESVGISLESVEQVLIGGSFGKYINVEKAVQIGLLPDMPWERFSFLGNTSVRGAYYALLSIQSREKIKDIASRMTYIELSADNTFYDAFMSALFLPHTDLSKFPSVEALVGKDDNPVQATVEKEG